LDPVPCGDVSVSSSYPKRQGNYSARVYAYTKEETGSQRGTSRAELMRDSRTTGNRGWPVREGAELWTRWSIYIPSTTASGNIPGGGGAIIMQQPSFGPNGPLANGMEHNGLLELDNQMRIRYSDGGAGAHEGVFWRKQFQPNTWYQLMIHKKYSSSASTGFVEIFVDGVQQPMCLNATCSTTGPRIMHRTIQANATHFRLQTGLYYNDSNDPSDVMKPTYYIDDFRVFSGAGKP
jgi:hypothetical protein